jgi:hypothetical protein
MTRNNRRPARRRWLVPAAFAVLLCGLVPALSQNDENFMPKGGRTLLLAILGASPNAQALKEIVTARHDEAEWRTATSARTNALSEREQKTLAAYLAVNMPLADPDKALAAASNPGALSKALPRDGRALAWNECQFCHSLFTSYLTQERDVQAWLNMFQSPFHREIKMTEKERQEFARYSAFNMPMKIDEVPPELRF